MNCPIVGYKIKDKALLQRSKELYKSDKVAAYVMKMQAIEEVDISALKTMLTNGKANPYQTGTQMMYSTIVGFLLSGNNYVHPNRVGKKAKELFPIPNMEIMVDNQDFLNPIRGYRVITTKLWQFEPDEIQHIKNGTPAPMDIRMEYLYGVSPLRAYAESLRAIKEGGGR